MIQIKTGKSKIRRKKMEDTEREIWVGENRFHLGEDDILYISTVGEIDDKLAVEFIKALRSFDKFPKIGGKRDVLVDINKGGKTSPRARKLFIETCEQEETGKVAMFGLHPVSRVLASFLIGVTAKKDMRFFKTKYEALAWLKESKRDE